MFLDPRNFRTLEFFDDPKGGMGQGGGGHPDFIFIRETKRRGNSYALR